MVHYVEYVKEYVKERTEKSANHHYLDYIRINNAIRSIVAYI